MAQKAPPADFNGEQQQQQNDAPPVNGHHRNVLEWTFEHETNKCAQLEEKMENMKHDIAECQKKLAKQEKDNEFSNYLLLVVFFAVCVFFSFRFGQFLREHELQVAANASVWRLSNPAGNIWNQSATQVQISYNGLKAWTSDNQTDNVFAVSPFSLVDCTNRDHKILLKYYEIMTDHPENIAFGLSADNNEHRTFVGDYPHSYSLNVGHPHLCYLAGSQKEFEWPPRAAEKPKINEDGSNVFGCGLLIGPINKEQSIFFTVNGRKWGNPLPIVTNAPLYPAVHLSDPALFVANFGDNPAIPFVYDVNNKFLGITPK